MRMILTGGGSGGHVYPALAIAEEIRQLEPGVEFTYVGTAAGMEADLVRRAGLPFAAVSAGRLIGKGLMARLRSAVAIAAGVVQAAGVLRRARPAVVLATGGFVSGPVLLAARLLRVPYCIWEGNAFPGSAVRLFSRGARAVFIPFAEGGRHFPPGTRLAALGNPVRRAVMDADRAAARAQMSLGDRDHLVLIFGGSQGALGIHRAVAGAAPVLAARGDVRLLHVTGPRLHDSVVAMYRQAGIDPGQAAWLELVPYHHDMPTALAAADLALTRAGATTIAELAARHLPAIIVPFPQSTHHHQEYNARALEQRGAATVIAEPDLTAATLAQTITALLDNPRARAQMSAALRAAAWPQAGPQIAATILSIARGHPLPDLT